MIRQTPGKIFLADQRGLLETHQFRRYCTLSFGAYADEHKGPVGRLRACNEEILAGGHHLVLPVAQPCQVLIIPVTGAVQTSSADSPPTLVHVEQVQLLTLPAGATLRCQNPYPDELVTFLHLWLHLEAPAAPVPARSFSFDFAALENRLLSIISPTDVPAAPPFSLHLGRFQGRQEAEYAPRPGGQLFAFVLAGAFELEGRLLHEKDALALWDADQVEIEALSNNALLLVLEV